VLWITAVQLDDAGRLDHQSLRRVRWHNPETKEEGEASITEMIALIRGHTPVYVSDQLLDRSAIVRVVDANPPYIRAWAHGDWGNDLLALPRFEGAT
jgi:hypothetical protein